MGARGFASARDYQFINFTIFFENTDHHTVSTLDFEF